MSEFRKLFEPGRIGALEVPNRIVMPAMEPGLADDAGILDAQRAGRYYSLRARGGAGLIITGNTAVSPEGRAVGFQPGLWSDEQVEAHRKTIEAVHEAGGLIFVQLSHAGREVHPLLPWKPVAPVSTPSPVLRSRPRALATSEIGDLVESFARAAARAVQAGADGIEIHGAHGYLVCQFLSPAMNHRDDEYGKDREGRLRFAVEVVRAVRSAIGKSVPLSFRISADEMIPGGIDVELASFYARAIEEAGADLLNVSACNYESAFYNLPNYYLEEGCFVHLAAALSKVVDIPVAAVGRIRNPSMAEEVLASGSADFVAMGRTLIADPFLPLKARSGAVDEIRPCLSCNKCLDSLSTGPVRCAVNPDLCEGAWPPRRGDAGRNRRVFVAGAGPAGLTAAIEAAWNGFDVTLFEEGRRPGGRLRLAAMPPHKSPVGEFRDWLAAEADRAGVKIETSCTLDAARIERERPDFVIDCTGSEEAPPPFSITDGTAVVSVEKAFDAPGELGDKVLIVGGGGEGAELADFLSERGIEVTIVERRRKAALDILPSLRYFLLARLEKKSVEVITRFTVEELGPGYVKGARGRGETERLEGFDSIVLAVGLRPRRSIADEIKDEDGALFIAGDAVEPRSILEAVNEGARAARSLPSPAERGGA